MSELTDDYRYTEEDEGLYIEYDVEEFSEAEEFHGAQVERKGREFNFGHMYFHDIDLTPSIGKDADIINSNKLIALYERMAELAENDHE